MKDEAERLMTRLAKVLSERQKYANEIKKATGEEKKKIREKLKLLDDKFWLLSNKLEYYESSFIIEDSEIIIKRSSNNIEGRYGIFLKNGKMKIGTIDYQGYHTSLTIGDIGYHIYDNYRGNNYSYKALCLLSNYLYENNINDFYISVFHDNKASIKIINKYGGNIIYQDEFLTTYQCETRSKKMGK